MAPALERVMQAPHHAVRHRVEGRRPIERDDAGGAAAVEQDFGGARHFRVRLGSRAMNFMRNEPPE
jgi:hypothetical protein